MSFVQPNHIVPCKTIAIFIIKNICTISWFHCWVSNKLFNYSAHQEIVGIIIRSPALFYSFMKVRHDGLDFPFPNINHAILHYNSANAIYLLIICEYKLSAAFCIPHKKLFDCHA